MVTATRMTRAKLIAAVRGRSLQQAAQWDAYADRLRGLVPKALDALEEALGEGADPKQRVAAALWVLRATGLWGMSPPLPEDEKWLSFKDEAELRAMLGEDHTGGEG